MARFWIAYGEIKRATHFKASLNARRKAKRRQRKTCWKYSRSFKTRRWEVRSSSVGTRLVWWTCFTVGLPRSSKWNELWAWRCWGPQLFRGCTGGCRISRKSPGLRRIFLTQRHSFRSS